MGFLNIVKSRITGFWNNPSAVTLLIIVPLLLSIVFSLLFPVSKGFPKDKRPVSLVFLSGNSIVHSGFEIVLSNIPEEEYSVTRVYVKSDGMDLLKSGDADVFLLFSTDGTAVEIYHSDAVTESASRIESITDAFLDYFRLNSITGGTEVLIGYQTSLERNGVRYQKILPESGPDSISYYSALFLIISLFYGAYYHAGKILRENGIYLRTAASGRSWSSIWAGITAGNTAAVFLQGAVIFAAGWLIFGKNPGNTLPVSILIIFTASFFSVNLVTLLFIAVKSKFIPELLTHFLLLFFSASGAKFLLYNSNALPDKLKYISPVYWLSTWMLKLSEKTHLYIYILVFTAVIAAGTAALLISRRIFLTRAGEKVLK